ncbi:MAG: HNH endonuclease [Nonlabens sp.]
MAEKRRNWTREETIVAFNVYCKIPFKNSSKTHPTVIKYAKIIGRSPSALNMKIGNFGRLDPELRKRGITGLGNGSKLDEEIWNEFHGNWNGLAYESERLICAFQNKNLAESVDVDLSTLPTGMDVDRLVKTRVNQQFFRSAILSSYNLKCCITGLSIPTFLVASHIKPWSKDKQNRTNPSNGLCLNSIHDKAFDKGFITITPDLNVKTSAYFDGYSEEESVQDFFQKFDGQPILKPDRFLPDLEFLDYHFTNVFIK